MKPSLSVSNIKIALSHPQLILGLLRGDDAAKLARRFVKMTLFNEVTKMIEVIRSLPESDGISEIASMAEKLSSRDKSSGIAYYYTLFSLVKHYKPLSVVETGVWWGTSSLVILQAMEEIGRGSLYSVDLPNVSYQYAPGKRHEDIIPDATDVGSIVPEKLRSRWTLIQGSSQDKLPELFARLDAVDLFVHDSEHTYDTVSFELGMAWPRIKRGGLILCDDASWTPAFADFTKAQRLQPLILRKYVGKSDTFGIVLKP